MNTPTPEPLELGEPDSLAGTFVEQIDRLQRDLAARERENQCDVCAGTGKPLSGKQCACNGSGKMSDAAITFRRAHAAALERCEKLEQTIASTLEWLEENQPDVFKRGLWEAVGITLVERDRKVKP